MTNNYAPKPFTKANVLKDLQDRKDNISWNRDHLPLNTDRRRRDDNDLDLIEFIMSDIRDIS